jgi:Xaa-Pro aminopeptidase
MTGSGLTDVASRVPFAWEDRLPWLELDFPIEEFEDRVGRIQRTIADEGLDALIVYGGTGSESNVRYISGFASFWGDNLVLVPATGAPILITNAIFHGEPMHSNIQTTWLEDVRPLLNPHSTSNPLSLVDLAAAALEEWGVGGGRFGIADTRDVPARVDHELREKLAGAEVVDSSAWLRRLRSIKSPAEIEMMRRLGAATSAGMDAGLDAVRPGVTESEIAAAVHAACIEAGVERMLPAGCFAIAGQRSFMKNVWPRPDKKVERDELVVVDIGARLGGYQSDMSRNIVAGEPSDEVRRLLEACLEAEEVGLSETKPGVTVSSVLNAMKGVIAEHGFAEWDWTTGHGAGMDILEEPFFGPDSQVLFEAGMTFYIEPMIVPTHVGTICIEDIVLVTETGCEELTTSRKRTW